jgi:ribosomal-protein-alanine N-acetyltransferase
MKRPAHAAELDQPGIAIARITERPADAETIERIGKESFPDHAFNIDDELAPPWTRFWTARRQTDGAALGFAIAWHVADELHVLSIATAPAERCRGVGTALMRVAIAYAASQRVRLILLEVRRSNRPALRLYRQLGFTVLGMRPKYYANNDEDALEMVLALDPATGSIVPGRDEIRIEI